MASSSRPIRVAVATLTLLSIGSLPRAASSQTKAACFTAAEAAQTLRDTHKLLDARAKFVTCAAPACPTAVRTDCSTWLADIDRALPSIVISAKDEAGNDDFDVEVLLDGAPLATHLDGSARAVDPGPHTVQLRWNDGAIEDRKVLVVEGQKAVLVSGAHPGAATPPRQGPTVSLQPRASDPIKTAGYVVGATGLAALVVGGVMGVLTIADVHAAKDACVPSNCDINTSPSASNEMQTARTLGNASTGLFAAGGALTVGGLIAILRPTSTDRRPATVGIVPALAGSGGMLSLSGAW